MVEEDSKLPTKAYNLQQAVADTPVGTRTVCWLPSDAALPIHLQTCEAGSFEFCLILLYQTYNIHYASKYTQWKMKICTTWGLLVPGVGQTVVSSHWLDVGSETEFCIHAIEIELLFDDAYPSTVVDD